MNWGQTTVGEHVDQRDHQSRWLQRVFTNGASWIQSYFPLMLLAGFVVLVVFHTTYHHQVASRQVVAISGINHLTEEFLIKHERSFVAFEGHVAKPRQAELSLRRYHQRPLFSLERELRIDFLNLNAVEYEVYESAELTGPSITAAIVESGRLDSPGMIAGLNQRSSTPLHLVGEIAWDEAGQRWVLALIEARYIPSSASLA